MIQLEGKIQCQKKRVTQSSSSVCDGGELRRLLVPDLRFFRCNNKLAKYGFRATENISMAFMRNSKCV